MWSYTLRWDSPALREYFTEESDLLQSAEKLVDRLREAKPIGPIDLTGNITIKDTIRSVTATLCHIDQIFTPHHGAESCVVCMYMAAQGKAYTAQAEDHPGNLDFVSQSDKELVIKHHGQKPRPGPTVQRVDIVLESHGAWSSLRLEQFLDEKMHHIIAAPKLEDIGVVFRAGLWPKDDVKVTERSTRNLKIAFTQHERDVCVFVPEEVGPEKIVPAGHYESLGSLRTCSPDRGPPPPYQQHVENLNDGHTIARQITQVVNIDLIRSWLAQCKSSHDHCADGMGEYPTDLTLVDVGRMCLVDVPVDSSRPRYLALSYVWGSVSQPVLTRAVSETWHAEGGLRAEDLPKTIADAIQLAEMIGYEYIWVDALCIIQDEHDTRHHQIAQMHTIYQQADATIVAADGSNCNEGLTGVSAPGSRMKRHSRNDLPGGLRLQMVPLSTRHSIQDSIWRTRGWTFQEELCSRRSIVFLPEVVVFSCPSAVWREDLQLKDGAMLQRDEGLESVYELLLSRGILEPRENISQFQKLVKQYMHRTLRWTKDIEDAFAGVAGMLKPTLGPIYHGIPEEAFDEVISGCWSGSTTLHRREGFPSWSWMGWMYSREQTDMGIQPQYSRPYAFSNPLAFYKLLPVVEVLGRGPDEDIPHGGIGSGPGLLSHFVPNEAELQARHNDLERQENVPSHLIAFHTSFAVLKLRSTPGTAAGKSREYRVVHPQTNRQITSIQLAVDFVEKNGSLHGFIVVAHDRDRRCFRLMLISKGQFAAERVNVTAQSRPVGEEEWCRLEPRRELIVMA